MTVKEIRKIHAKKLDVESETKKKSFEDCAVYRGSGCCDNCFYEDNDGCPFDKAGYKVADWCLENEKQSEQEKNANNDNAEDSPAKEPLSILGYPKRVYPEDSLIATSGCGKNDCFSCRREGCDIRQEECYCVEAPLGKPYPCNILKDGIETLKQGLGDYWNACQFLNLNLAEVRAGDGEPVPCCKECKSPCRYPCGRIAPELAVAPAQEESESIDALDFSVRVYLSLIHI